MDTGTHYLELTKLCMDQTYSQINVRFYKQNFGTSMGNAPSPFLADFEVKIEDIFSPMDPIC
jgi:hypothetical protein